MKKLFTLVAAVLATISLSAAKYTPTPGENVINPIISSLVDGDTIEFTNGTYTEWQKMTFTTKVTLIAAEGTTPKVDINKICIKNDFEINGIYLTSLSSSDYLLRTEANVTGTIAIKNCKLDNQAPTPFIYLSSNSVGALIIDNCIFTGTAKTQGGLIYASSSTSTIGNLSITNSTFYNFLTQCVYCTAVVNAKVDRCTFYNKEAQILYVKGTLTSCAVTNCIFTTATAIADNCIKTYGGTVDNCVYFNLSGPRSDDATISNCVNEDPMFADATKYDFTLDKKSPALTAATDGKAVGDPRWAKGTATAVENTAIQTNIVKRVINGQVIIERDGVRYNALGTVID